MKLVIPDGGGESKSTTRTSHHLPQPSPTPTTSHRLRNSLVFPTPLQTLSLPPIIKDGPHGFIFPNDDATASLSSQSPYFDPGLVPVESMTSRSYTSLRDLVTSASSSAAINSPASATPALWSRYQIPIRNRLVKHAAWAYLQPMSSPSFTSSSRSQLLFTRFWDCISSWRPLARLTEYVEGHFLPAMRKVLDRIRCAVKWLIARH